MSGQAGYDIGKELDELMGRKYNSRLSRTLAKIGNILGWGIFTVAVAFCIYCYYALADEEGLFWIGFAVAIGGHLIIVLFHFIARKCDK